MGETKSDDSLCIAIALERRVLTTDQVQACCQTIEEARKHGANLIFLQVACQRRLLSPDQAEEIAQEARRRGPLPQIAGYEILSKIGQGGMGTVYKARQLSLNRLVALKVLPPAFAADTERVARFRREAMLAAQLNHPNAVQVHDVGETGGCVFIVMEYVDGVSVDKMLLNEPMEERRALEIIKGVAQALLVAHRKGIIHRDVKPANIMLTRDGQPKLADLGLAKQLGAAAEPLTWTGGICGTPTYMSPEQFAGREDIDLRTDIYSLGTTLYRMVCGKLPYEGQTPMAIMRMHSEGELLNPKGGNPRLSAAVAGLIVRMTARDPKDRFRDCAEIVDATQVIEDSGESPTVVPGRRTMPDISTAQTQVTLGRRVRSLLAARGAAVIVAGIVILVVAGSVLLLSERGADTRSATRPMRSSVPATAPKTTPAIAPATTPAPSATGRTPVTTPAPLAPASTKPVAIPKGWTSEVKRVKCATPEGDVEKDITYYTNTIGMKFVLVPAGEFVMGDTLSPVQMREKWPSETLTPAIPRHRVTIARQFWIGATEVTVRAFDLFVQKTGYRTEAETKGKASALVDGEWKRNMRGVCWIQPGWRQTGEHPVAYVTKGDAAAFCAWLSREEQLAGIVYRLPSEAEWEYAARAGSRTIWYWGDSDAGVAGRARVARTHAGGTMTPAPESSENQCPVAVGTLMPNVFGMYDVTGNVMEWCVDAYAPAYSGEGQNRCDPVEFGGERSQAVARGGSWAWTAAQGRLAGRWANNPKGTGPSMGFRVLVGHELLSLGKATAAPE